MPRKISFAKQEEILTYIKDFIGRYNYSPTVREIASGVGLKSPASVTTYLSSLEESGYIRRRPESPRTIEVIGSGIVNAEYKSVQIPLIKAVVLDMPLFSKENVKGYFSFPHGVMAEGGVPFAIEAPDDSMNGAGILKGEIVFVIGMADVSSGDCILCLVDGCTYIRYFYLQDDSSVKLVSANNGYRDILVPQCQVVGKIASVYKSIGIQGGVV